MREFYPARKPSTPMKIDWVLLGLWVMMLFFSLATLAGCVMFFETVAAWVWRVA